MHLQSIPSSSGPVRGDTQTGVFLSQPADGERPSPAENAEGPFSADFSLQAASRLEVLAVIEEALTTRQCLTLAARACQAVPDAALTALHIQVDPLKIFAAPEEISLQQLRTRAEGTARQRANQAHSAFAQWVAFSGYDKARWVERIGTLEDTLPVAAQAADLVVIARPHNLDASDAFHAAIFDTGRLVLFVPEAAARRAEFNRHVAIAWKPRPQARRAVEHAMPWLRQADRVTVISVDEPDSSHAIEEAVGLLAINGVAVDVRRGRTESGEHIAGCILREAEAIGADLLVMGAYRFGMLVEWVLGGVTSEIVSKADLPILMMH